MNAKEEFLRVISKYEVLCAQIRFEHSYDENVVYTLNQGYTQEELNEFLDNLNFEYDSGYGRQYLYGTIWCKNNTWFSRHEYDGSEYWEHNECPPFPEKKPAKEEFSSIWYDDENSY